MSSGRYEPVMASIFFYYLQISSSQSGCKDHHLFQHVCNKHIKIVLLCYCNVSLLVLAISFRKALSMSCLCDKQ